MSVLKKSSVEDIRYYIESINQFNLTPEKGTTRLALSSQDSLARKFIKEKATQLGLKVKEDAVGNIFATLEGTDPSLPAVWTGSHTDTVPNGGMFDGIVGVIGGFEAIRLIKESRLPVHRNINLVIFTSEESASYSKGCLGSRAMAGVLTLDDAKNTKNEKGESFAKVLENLGYDLNQFDNVKIQKNKVSAFVELHIEQGIVLEQLGIPIGIVTAIAAPTDIHVHIIGKQGHAGATPMHLRYDAMTAASEIILKLETLARASTSTYTVGTVGKILVSPNAANVIPGEVSFSIDIRGSEFDSKDQLVNALLLFIDDVMEKRKVNITTEIINHDIPKHANTTIVEIIKNVCNEKSCSYHEMVSGAYHDSMFVAEFAPFGMIFIPCKEGISHNPQEWANYEDISEGIDVLAKTLLTLANQ